MKKKLGLYVMVEMWYNEIPDWLSPEILDEAGGEAYQRIEKEINGGVLDLGKANDYYVLHAGIEEEGEELDDPNDPDE